MRALQTATSISFKNILFLTDLSEASEPALAYAIGLARHYNAQLFPAHASDPVMLAESASPNVLDEVLENSRHRVNNLVRASDVETHPLFGHGSVERFFPRWIQENGIDLVIIGTHGRRGLGRLVLGSIAEYIFRNSPCPVLTVGPHVAFRPFSGFLAEKILFPTDLGPHAEFASTYALSFAKETHGQMVLMNVITVNKASPADRAAMAEKARERLDAMLPSDAGTWCRPETIVEIGDPASEILGWAEKERPDLIVLGLPPKKQFSATFASGVTYKVVVGAPCPVLTIRDMSAD